MFSVITIEDEQKWKSIVQSFSRHDIYYFPDYIKAFQLHGDGEPLLLLYEGKNLKGINTVMKRDISKDIAFIGKLSEGKSFDVITPYGYGGFLLEGNISDEELKLLDEEYTSFCISNGIVSEFVRFHPILETRNYLDTIYDIRSMGNTISIELNSIEKIWDNFTRENRNKIRKAMKSGVKIYWGRNPELFERFIKIYNMTMDENNANSYYYFNQSFYESILGDIKYNSLIFYADYQGAIIAMAIILFINGHMHYHLSGMDKSYRNLAPVNLLLFEAACWGCENGFKTFHLGGGVGSKNDSLYEFKSSFNRSSTNKFAIGRKIFDTAQYERLVSIRKADGGKAADISFFPEYRGCYISENDR